MPIEISILYSPDNVELSQTSLIFPDEGGTLGRSSSNFWSLQDPNKYMSSIHAKIECVAGQYYLTDKSTNGTFINGSTEPVGNSNQVALIDGDHFTISDYEFVINIKQQTAEQDMFAHSPFAQDDNTDPFADVNYPTNNDFDFPLNPISNDDGFIANSNSFAVNDSPITSETIDPMAILDRKLAPKDSPLINSPFINSKIPDSGSASFTPKSHDEEHHESQPIVTDAIDWPVAKPETPQIPDNWDDWDADPMSSNTFVSNSTESVPQEHGFSASPFPETIDNNFGINDFANSTGSNQPTNQFSASPFPETVDNNSFGISDFANSAEANQPTNQFSTSPFPETVDNNFGISDFANSTESNLQDNEFSASPSSGIIDNSFEIGDFSHSESEDIGFEGDVVSSNDFNIGDFETNKMKGHYFDEKFDEKFDESPIESSSIDNSVSQEHLSQGEFSGGSQSTSEPHLLNSAVNSMPNQVNKTYSEAEYNELQQHNKQLQEQIVELTRQLQMSKQHAPTYPSTSTANNAELNNVVEAMGLSKWNLDANKINEINQTVGLLMRETMLGMMQVLKFRKKIKEEFRINVTTIQSVENNPLKFSANIDDAMENMFIKENNAYKSPVDAVKEGFESIAEHQVAVVAGMQAAFRGMIERFDPLHLESRFEKYNSSSFLSLGQKTKRWSDYKAYHKELTENLDDSFQHLFGYDFVQAYEEQMQQLISARISKS